MQVAEGTVADGGGCSHTHNPKASSKMGMKRMLQHCLQGGTLDVQVLDEAAQAQVQSVVESELSTCTCADVSGFVKENSAQNGPDSGDISHEKGQEHHEPRLKTLLTLLASWHAVCLKAEKFVHAKQLCAMLMDAEKHSSASSSKMIRKYINTVQQVCKKMHGFILDIPCAA